MRGGTSTGVVLWQPHLAPYAQHRDEIIRKIMGVPEVGEMKGNKQITGLGRGPSTNNKVDCCSCLGIVVVAVIIIIIIITIIIITIITIRS